MPKIQGFGAGAVVVSDMAASLSGAAPTLTTCFHARPAVAMRP